MFLLDIEEVLCKFIFVKMNLDILGFTQLLHIEFETIFPDLIRLYFICFSIRSPWSRLIGTDVRPVKSENRRFV